MPPDINSIPSSHSASPSSPIQHRDAPLSSEPQVQFQPQFQPQSLDSFQSPRSPTRSGRPSVSERRRSVHNPTGELPSSTSEHRPSVGHAFRNASPSGVGGSQTVTVGDPHHHRTPSLGELHQELEQEQEAQVNRLLQTIRSQQLQLQQLQQQQQQSSTSDTPVAEDSTTSSEPSASVPSISPFPAAASRPSPQLSSSLSNRRHSRSSSRTTSPSLRPLHGSSVDSSRGVMDCSEWTTSANERPARRSSRDESAFYHAEASMLMRENQILKQRIRDLERQIGEVTTTTTGTGNLSMPPLSADIRTAAHPAITDTESTGQTTQEET